MKKQRGTKSEFAREIGRDESYVCKRLKRGKFPTAKDGTIDFRKAKAWWDTHIKKKHANKKYQVRDRDTASRKSNGPGRGTEGDGPVVEGNGGQAGSTKGLSFTDRKDKADAEKKEIDVAKLRGKLVEKEKVEATVFGVGRKARDILMAIPRRLSGTLAVETDQRTIQVILEQEIEKGLRPLEGMRI